MGKTISFVFLALFCIIDLYRTEPLQIDQVFNGVEESDKNALLDVIRRVGYIETINSHIKEENKRLRDDVIALQSQIVSIKADYEVNIAELQSEINELRSKSKQQEDLITKIVSIKQAGSEDLQYATNINQNSNEELISYGRGIEDSVKYGPKDLIDPVDESPDIKTIAYGKQVQEMEDEKRRESGERLLVRRENEVNVAFYATIGQHHIAHAGTNQTIVFDDVITNLGNAYSKFAGDFRAPVGGTYVFSVTLMAYAANSAHYRFVKNGITVGNIYVGGKEGPYATSAMTTVLDLQQGDDVSIQNIDSDKNLHGYAYSVFSGFLLQQHFVNQAVVGK
ncbi:uncharacterized protein LOC132733278 isoform X2 [Ruditapes philippinarum]|uniref:uncharacterized protein LOC132733278 isoform X2 n=1 Tax=Ruditapes philippinarum TaxID=129788 RepID=UPI00295AF8A8|nr:uncharacterized protein LOC132733278 isoform X2 [Ruditapes philippinarum]